MTVRIWDILAQSRTERLFGRARELTALMQLVSANRPIVTYVHGIPGIGKSALCRYFDVQARAAGAAIIALDCRSIEPTERGFLRALSDATGLPISDVESATGQIATIAPRVVLLIDQYDVLGLIDTWLCQTFIPALPHSARVAIFGRRPPTPQWSIAPDWYSLLTCLQLDALGPADSKALLCDAGLQHDHACCIASAGHGHPLALQLAARAWRERPYLNPMDLDTTAVTARLVDIVLADIVDPSVRRAIEAASTIRRVTEPLLATIFPDTDPRSLYAQLRGLPIFEQLHDGLALHEALRHAIAASLKASDPERSRFYRTAAWQYLRGRIGRAPASDLWRDTADTIYLLENPIVRNAFFPAAVRSLVVSPAQPADGDAILRMIGQHDGPEATHHMSAWWSRQRSAFHVVRDAYQHMVGFYCLATADRIDPYLLVEDPVTASWQHHVSDNPVQRGQKALFLRRWLSATDGEAPSAVQAACWLDIKRTYLELRPALRRVYLTLHAMAPYARVAEQLGFRQLDATVDLDGKTYQSALLDFGPSSVDGWISSLLAVELGEDCNPEQQSPLDANARELILDGRRIALTQKEFALLHYLHTHARRAVSRDELLDEVWGWNICSGSNVVDVLVRVLRRKLGADCAIIETVRGIGYRYRRLPHNASCARTVSQKH